MQHYQKNVLGILKFCETCGKKTMWNVDQGRVRGCSEPHVKGLSKAQEKRAKKQADKQLELF